MATLCCFLCLASPHMCRSVWPLLLVLLRNWLAGKRRRCSHSVGECFASVQSCMGQSFTVLGPQLQVLCSGTTAGLPRDSLAGRTGALLFISGKCSWGRGWRLRRQRGPGLRTEGWVSCAPCQPCDLGNSSPPLCLSCLICNVGASPPGSNRLQCCEW